eukprot:7674468-Pyramimonas_sp.AAC.1
MGQCLSAAREAPLSPITILDVDVALPSLPATKAKRGWRAQSRRCSAPAAVSSRLEPGRRPSGAWSCDPQGSRPTPRKKLSKVRAKYSCEWSAVQSAFWDSAIAGSPALRSALIRAVMDQGAGALSFEHA